MADTGQLTIEQINEQVVLSALLINQEIRDNFAYDISKDDFTYKNHQCYAQAIHYMYTNRMTFVPDVVYEISNKFDDSASVDYKYITGLIKLGNEQKINLSSFKYYIDRVRYRALALVTHIEYGQELTKSLMDPKSDYPAALKLMDNMRDKFIQSKVSSEQGYNTIEYHAGKWKEEFELRKKGRNFIPLGYPHIDYCLNEGLAMGKVSVIGGRPGSGKSTFAINIMDRIGSLSIMAAGGNTYAGGPVSPFVLNRPIPCALCALEMNSIGTIDRLLALRTKHTLTEIIRNPATLNSGELKTLDNFLVDYSTNPYLFIDDNPRQNLSLVARNINRLKHKLKTEELIVFIDLFGRLEDMNENVKTQTSDAYERTLRRVQILAKELNVHFCLVAQISRQAEGVRDNAKKKVINNRPSKRHLKNSGAFEEVADLIFLLYRQKYYQPEVIHDLCEISIAKQRQGLEGKTINLMFDGSTSSLYTTKEFLVEQTTVPNLSLVTENDFKAGDKDVYYMQLPLEERPDGENTVQHTPQIS